MNHSFDQPQENLKKLTIPKLNDKLQKIISSYFFYNITKEITDKTNPEIYSNLKNSIVISICHYKEAEFNFFIIGFENTILKIQESSISFIEHLLSSNSHLIYNFSPATKCIFDERIKFKYNESDILLESSNINEYIQSTKENQLNISILQCILQYLFKKSYIKLNQKNRISDFYINETKPKLFDKDEYINIEIFFYGSVFRTQLIYYIEKEEILIMKEPTNATQNFSYLINREEKIYKLLNHPLLPKFYGTTNENNYLVIEYINGKSLFHIKDLKLSYNEKIKIIYEIMILISYFHKNELILRDLKPDNIIIDHNKTAVFVDFDRVIGLEDESNTNEFSYYFSAPETQSGNVSYKSDIYSLGMIIYYIMIEKNPTQNNIITFNDFGQCEIIKKIFKDCIKEDPKDRKNIMGIINTFLEDCASLIQPDDLMNINNIFIEFDYLKDDPRKEFKLGNLFLHSKDITKYINKAIHYLTLASNKNDPEAQYNLGVIYYEGKYVTKDVVKAINYFKMADNYAPAQFFLGFIYNDKDINKAIYYYSLSAKQNYAQALLNLGVIYYEGKYVTKDITKGIRYFTLAADKNNLQAQINLGFIYYEGKFINRDINKAIHYFTLAADKNDSESQFMLGLIFLEGKFIKRNIENSINYFSLAANQNNSNAQFELGLIYYNGQYVQRDINKSIHYLTLSAKQNHPDALFLLGIIYFNDDFIPRNIEKSIRYFELAAEQNNLKAQINCGQIYYEGEYTKQNIDKSIYYYQLAANQNSILAIRNLGFIYLKIDINKSIFYYRFAADQNDIQSIYNLALIYYNGDYVNRNIDLAIYYFQLAANQDYDKAQFQLGLIYFEDKYITRDINKAIYYFTLAANQNNSSAQNNLGFIYQSGEYVPRDINKAIYYFILSANQDNPYAQYTLGYMYFKGKYAQIDINKSFHFFELASRHNFAPAQFYLGIFYLTGLCVDKDINKALNYLLSSPENKDFAMFEIGYFYLEGKYVKKDIEESIFYFKEASSLENQFAQNNLGIIYKDIKNNIGKAINYFENAIEKYKNSLSMYNLAHLYIYEDKTTERIGKSIKYLIDLSNNNFQYADDLLCIALVKKYGFDIENIKKNIDIVPDRIYLKMKKEKINDETVYETQYKYYKTIDFLYNHLIRPIQSKSLINQNQPQINNANLKSITSDFYDGFYMK